MYLPVSTEDSFFSMWRWCCDFVSSCLLIILLCCVVANAALRGADAATQARVLQWMSWADSELLPASCAWVFPYLGIMPFNKQVIANPIHSITELFAKRSVLKPKPQ